MFTLKYLNGKDLSQIAQELGISKNTVKVHLAKSKRFVQDYIQVHGDISAIVGATLILENILGW